MTATDKLRSISHWLIQTLKMIAIMCRRNAMQASFQLHKLLWIALSLAAAFCFGQDEADASAPGNCAAWSGAECSWEPNLKAMKLTGLHEETFYAYVTPDVSTFYNETAGSRKPAKMKHTGMFGKFINLSPDTVRVYWEGRGSDLVYIADVNPFSSAGTATYPSHVFVVTPKNDQKKILTKWEMQSGNSLYYYDPFNFDYNKAQKALRPDQLTLYGMQYQNRVFAEQYKKFTGTDWLALHGQKLPPRFHMWRADAIGQTHTVETEEIHFVEMPPQEELDRGTSIYGPRPDEKNRMRRYRDKYPTMTLTLKALSCAPRVFEIENFLSEAEVDHIIDIAKRTQLARSGTTAGAGDSGISDTRTSTNDWIPRNKDFVIDAIYQRAAAVLQIDEKLLRWRHKQELPEFSESMISIAERLQLVHYGVGEKYTPHHDFVMPDLVAMQPSRFVTVLFYLNDDMEGGETAFPIWLNAETPDALTVKPKKGKAVLFYSLLPDGNYDERSLHEAKPVTTGEKYLTNLWVWDPMLDHTRAAHA